MNNDMPNNNQNNDLNPISLGSVEPVAPLEPMDQIDTLDDVGIETSNLEIPNNVSADNSYDIPEPINNFNTTPNFNNIGVVPPIADPIVETTNGTTPKKKGNKLLFVLIIVLLIAAIGVGVYIFLGMANQNKPRVVVKQIQIEAGSEISTLITDYANFTNIDSSACMLDTTEITDTTKVGEKYEFKITCNETQYTGTATIIDTKAPVVEIKDVTIEINKEVKAEDFIQNCVDASECTYTFKEEEKVKEYLSVAGTNLVSILVRDTSGNETEVTAKLIVSDTPIASLYLVCKKADIQYRLGFAESELVPGTKKIHVFKLTEEAFNNLKEQVGDKNELTYGELTGIPTFNENDRTLELAVPIEDLNTEMNGTVPSRYNEVNSFYRNQGFVCVPDL